MANLNSIAIHVRSVARTTFVVIALLCNSLLFAQTVTEVAEVLTVPPCVQSSSSDFCLPQTGYWIVSTAASPQSFFDTPPVFCAGVSRHENCKTPRNSCLDELCQQLIPGIPVCIVVHGSFMDSPSVVPEASATWRWLKEGSCGQSFQMIYFSWPSDRPLTALASIDVAVLGKRASRNGFYLASLIEKLPAECPISLVGHSHGTRVISSSLHLMAGGVVEGYQHVSSRRNGRRIRTVFIASAIDHDWLNPGERFDRALCSTECLLTMTNHLDPALMIYPFRRIGSSRALGCTGFTSKDYTKLGARGGKVRNLDVSTQIRVGHLWPNYVSRPNLARQIGNYVYFSDVIAQSLSAPEVQEKPRIAEMMEFNHAAP